MYSSGSSDPVIMAGMWGGIEGGFHEANARFFENMIGHSRAYWDYYYPQIQEEIPMFREIPEERFYNVIHQVKPTLRRISADEVTYSLHAILRFELERDYFAGKLRAEDMAEAWNDKYEEYLGYVRPMIRKACSRHALGGRLYRLIFRAMPLEIFMTARFWRL